MRVVFTPSALQSAVDRTVLQKPLLLSPITGHAEARHTHPAISPSTLRLDQRTSRASKFHLLNQRIAGAAVKELVFTLHNTVVVCEMAVLALLFLWWTFRNF